MELVGDVHLVASVLKFYLMTQEEPFFPQKVSKQVVEVFKSTEEEANRLEYICSIINYNIPGDQRRILHRLLVTLNRVINKHSCTKMDALNLGIIFAAVLFRVEASDVDVLQNAALLQKCVSMMITNMKTIFTRRFQSCLIGETNSYNTKTGFGLGNMIFNHFFFINQQKKLKNRTFTLYRRRLEGALL